MSYDYIAVNAGKRFLTTSFSPWLVYDGELKLERQRFLNDPLFNTLQSDLYDSDMAEVLGRIETSVLPDFTNYDWSEGNSFLLYNS